MAELRWHIIKDWVMIASHRQDRPQMPKDWCPCPSTAIDDYEVMKYDNDFPALMQILLNRIMWLAFSRWRLHTAHRGYSIFSKSYNYSA